MKLQHQTLKTKVQAKRRLPKKQIKVNNAGCPSNAGVFICRYDDGMCLHQNGFMAYTHNVKEKNIIQETKSDRRNGDLFVQVTCWLLLGCVTYYLLTLAK